MAGTILLNESTSSVGSSVVPGVVVLAHTSHLLLDVFHEYVLALY